MDDPSIVQITGTSISSNIIFTNGTFYCQIQISAKAPGSTTIKALSNNGQVKFSQTLTVVRPNPVSVTVTADTLEMYTSTTLQAKAQVNPALADQTVEWKSQNPEILSVDDQGIVSSFKAGKGIITASTPTGLSGEITITVYDPEESVTLNASELSMRIDDQNELTATVFPETANPSIRWSSSDPSVVSVKDGKIIAISSGNATVTATSNNGKSAECDISVTLPPADEVRIDTLKTEMVIGEIQPLEAFVLPEKADQTVNWSSSDTGVIDLTGETLEAKSVGTAVVTAETANGKKAFITISVTLPPADEVRIDTLKTEMVIGETQPLKASVLPEKADQTVTWSSTDTNVVVLTGETLEAKSEGTAVLTAEAANGKKASMTIRVKKPDPEEVKLSESEITIKRGESAVLTASVRPEDADQIVAWSTSDPSVATVENGKITASKIGSAVITAKTSNDLTAECKVAVSVPDCASVSIEVDQTEIIIGETATASQIVLPSDALQDVTWNTSDPEIATISSTGVVTGKQPGKVLIRATTSNGISSNEIEMIIVEKLVPIYRLYLPLNEEHLYTSDYNEYQTLWKEHGWGDEGVAWYAPSEGTPVFRLYNPVLRNHLYTTDSNEVKVLTSKHGWVQDNNGKALYYSDGEVPIYRVYNKGLKGMHHLTTDLNEYNTLPKHGWDQEGDKLRAKKIGSPVKTNYYKK